MTPRVGQIVHFVWHKESNRGQHRAAIVVAVHSETNVNLSIFPDGTNDYPQYDYLGSRVFVPTLWLQNIPYSNTEAVGTWHFMEE